jgi:hypothetical protein
MKNIQAVKIGTTVNVSIDGKLQKKVCNSLTDANELFKLVLEVKENPTDEAVKKLRCYLNERTRIALMAGLESDPDSGEVYLAGFNTPVPLKLIEVVKEYHENDFPLDAIINFWKLLMINPDVRVRESLFNFIQTHDFVLTDKGYMVVYKAVYRKNESNTDKSFAEFVSNQVLHVKKDWKCSPNKYVVYRKLDDIKDVHGTLAITKIETAEGWNEKEEGVEVLGNLGELFNSIFNTEDDVNKETLPEYTDMHSRTMTIVLGQPVRMERKECDGDPERDCSYGLHCGATKYVENFAGNSSIILACLVNPANVVAVPYADHSKMRVAEYFPFAYATYENGKIDIIEQKYFEDDYQSYEEQELEAQIAKVKASEKPIETAKNAEDESRPMSELMKMLETRLFDIVE